MSTILANAFWLFLGVVAGAFIQHALNILTIRKHARNALKVMQIEIAYNLGEVDAFLDHVRWLKERISAGQIEEDQMFLPMHKFDYSTIGPLSSSGHFHMLLGAENLRNYLEFFHFFRNDNANFLTEKLRSEHQVNKSMAFLEWVETRAKSHSQEMKKLEAAKLTWLRSTLVLGPVPKQLK